MLYYVILMSMFFHVKEPMLFMVFIMTSMLSVIFNFFFITNNYWSCFVIILSFLVGLFLLFVYIVSLLPANNSMTLGKNKLEFFMMISIFLTVLSTSKHWLNMSFSGPWSGQNKIQETEMMFESSNYTVFFCILMFLLFIIFLFFFMKKNKKMMKSSK